MNDADAHSDLQEALVDLRRHLEWQREEGGAALLVDLSQVKTAPVATAPARRPDQGAEAPRGRASGAAAAAPPAVGPRATSAPAVRSAARSLAPPAAATRPPVSPAPVAPEPVVVRTLDEVRRELGNCQRCHLCSDRRNIVYGSGNPRAQLVFVGEAPGVEEDAQGVPFVGEAGQLLTKMIVAMGFTRDEVYICNVVKCRPPENRTPQPEEIAACEPFLRAQLQAIRPKVIVALGKVATHTLLGVQTPISSLRGQWHEYQGIPLMPTFHPEYLNRQPAQKRVAWTDLQQVMKVFGKAPPRPAE